MPVDLQNAAHVLLLDATPESDVAYRWLMVMLQRIATEVGAGQAGKVARSGNIIVARLIDWVAKAGRGEPLNEMQAELEAYGPPRSQVASSDI